MTKTEKETGAQQKQAGKSWSTPRSEMTEVNKEERELNETIAKAQARLVELKVEREAVHRDLEACKLRAER